MNRFWRDTSGSVFVEFAAVIFPCLLVLFGVIEFANLLRQWNAASKAVAWGARLAAVSDPVSSDLKNITGLSSGVLPGDPMPAFTRVCSGLTKTCTGGTYSAVAMSTIVYGRANAACAMQASANLGMCDFYPAITPANVRIQYVQTGMGFAGRPGGPVPTVIVSLTGMTFNFIFLGSLLGPITLPPFTTTVTGEDLAKG